MGQPCVRDTPSGQRVVPLINMQAPKISLVGPECLPIGMNCNGDTQDTVYHVSLQMPLDDQKVYVIVGALSTKTGNATYAGLGLNSGKTKLGFDNIPDDDLEGSAGGYGAAVAEPGKFFLYYIARTAPASRRSPAGTAVPCRRPCSRVTRRIRLATSSAFRCASLHAPGHAAGT